MKFIFSKNKSRVQNTIKYCADCIMEFYKIKTNAGMMGQTIACGTSMIT